MMLNYLLSITGNEDPQKQAYEFGFAAESAYSMAQTQMKYKKLLEADEVAFEGEIETAYCESLGIDTSQQQAALTLDGDARQHKQPRRQNTGCNNASDRTADQANRRAQNPYPHPLPGSSDLWCSACSGKTHFAEQEIKRRREAGHKNFADPHAAYASWPGCEVIGAGMDYQAIDTQLAKFAAEVSERYTRIYKEPNPQFEPITFVCDEFTNWASRCKSSGEFFQAALSDGSLAEMFVIFVSHARTLKGLGNAAGMADTRDASLLEIETLGRIDPESGKAVPRLEAMVKLPGQSLGDRTLVKLAKNSSPGVENSAPNSNQIAPPCETTSNAPTSLNLTCPSQSKLNYPNQPLNL